MRSTKCWMSPHCPPFHNYMSTVRQPPSSELYSSGWPKMTQPKRFSLTKYLDFLPTEMFPWHANHSTSTSKGLNQSHFILHIQSHSACTLSSALYLSRRSGCCPEGSSPRQRGLQYSAAKASGTYLWVLLLTRCQPPLIKRTFIRLSTSSTGEPSYWTHRRNTAKLQKLEIVMFVWGCVRAHVGFL